MDGVCAVEETDELNNSRGPVVVQVGAGVPATPTPTPTPGPTPVPARLFAFVADETRGLRVLNVTDPAAPQLVSTLDTPGEANDVVMIETASQKYALVADGSAGLQIVNVNDPAAPQLVGTYNSPGDARSVAVGIIANVPYAFVADGDWGPAGSGHLDPHKSQRPEEWR